MTNYKLIDSWDGILRLNDNGTNTSIPNGGNGWAEYQAWLVSNTPEAADVPTAAQIAHALEVAGAGPMAKAFYDANPAVKAFIRDKTPAERKAEINAMTSNQLRVVVSYLVEAVICVIKERYLD